MTINAAVDLMVTLLTQAAHVGKMIRRARADGRDSLNQEELEDLLIDNDQARNDLQASIDRAKQEGR